MHRSEVPPTTFETIAISGTRPFIVFGSAANIRAVLVSYELEPAPLKAGQVAIAAPWPQLRVSICFYMHT